MQLNTWTPFYASLAPAGFYVAARLGFYAPEEEINSFPQAWVDHYTVMGLAVQDPFMRWVYQNEGTVRWSELDLPDPAGVQQAYIEHNLRYGCLVSVLDALSGAPTRSFGIFARNDREFKTSELAKLQQSLRGAKPGIDDKPVLTEAQIEALRLLSNGKRFKEIAHELNISESAVKARLRAAMTNIGAKTATQATSKAARLGLL
ncbi:MAG: LuxR C-terminal-related transcriptional regulator [Paracoccaceae bacterium]|nr:transcriptional regulator, LuxR family protein [Rhodobacteraceae bacterium HTCC2150]MDG1531147.1 LuxR C-terminal-related transcriptional regulator [Paracoccaceae bacterium]